VPRKMFGPKKDDFKGQFEILHNKELFDFNRLTGTIRIMK